MKNKTAKTRCFLMLMLTFTLSLSACGNNATKGLRFTLIDDDTAYAVWAPITNEATEIVIPATYRGKPVKAIRNNGFCYRTNLKSIVIPDSVTLISDTAFADCASLENIIIPDSVTHIGDQAFENCTSLKSIVIPGSVKSTGNFTFRDCTNLKNVIISEGVVSIGWVTFYDCTSLSSLVIPESVISIGHIAFENCDALTDVFYGGKDGVAWDKINIDGNAGLIDAMRYYYSETHPTENPQDFWRFVDGIPTVWE